MRTTWAPWCTATIAAVLWVAAPKYPAAATTFTVAAGDVPALVSAITTANGNGIDDAIDLAAGATYDLTAPDNGLNGLPVVTSKIAINGNGATITRTGATAFRIFEVGAGGDLTLDHVTLSGGNVTGGLVKGGGILVSGASAKLTLTGATVTGNTSAYVGGGIAFTSVSQVLTMTGSHVDANQALTGGGLYFEGNNCTADISRSTINGNVMNNIPSGVEGGGIAFENTGTLTLTDSTVNGNTGTAGAGNSDGAGIALESTAMVTISRTTISNNVLTANGGNGVGGGIADEGGATLVIKNSTLSGNMVTGPMAANAGGGLVSEAGGGTVTLDNVTITNNSANRGGGLAARAGAMVRFQNTIVAGNPAPADSPDCFIDALTALTSLGYNLVQSTTGCAFTAATGDVIGMSPGLGALQDNGGPTRTHALLAGSPAIDKGDPATPGSDGTACEAVDQRGVMRPQGAACDIGAFETSATAPPGGCERAATFVSIDCRLDALIARIEGAAGFSRPQTQMQLVHQLTKAKGKKLDAETLCAKPDVKHARSRLKQVIRGMIQFGHRLRSNTVRRRIETGLRTELITSGDQIQADLKTLRGALRCPDAAPGR